VRQTFNLEVIQSQLVFVDPSSSLKAALKRKMRKSERDLGYSKNQAKSGTSIWKKISRWSNKRYGDQKSQLVEYKWSDEYQ